MKSHLRVETLALIICVLFMRGVTASTIVYPPTFGQKTDEGQYEPRLVEVYRQDFEGTLEGVGLFGGEISSDPVISGDRSALLLADGAMLQLGPEPLGLQPLRTYYAELEYRILNPGNTSVPFGLFFEWEGVISDEQDSSGPVTGLFPVEGRFGRSIRIGDALDATITIIGFGGQFLVDNINVYRHDSILSAAEPPILGLGFPRLLSYHLGSVGEGALRGGVPVGEVVRNLGLFDVVTGVDIDHTTDAYDSTRRLREINPDILLLPYLEAFVLEVKDVVSTGGSSNIYALYQNGIEDAWFMRGPEGNKLEAPFYPGHFQMNHTAVGGTAEGVSFSDYIHRFVSRTVLPSGLWAGVHFDQTEWFPNPLLGANDGFNTINEPLPPIDLDEDGNAESEAELHAAWYDAFQDYFRELRAEVGPANLLYGNAGTLPQRPSVLERLNGMQSELTTPYPIDEDGNWITLTMGGWFDLYNRQHLADEHLAPPQVIGMQYTGIGLGTLRDDPAIGISDRVPELEARDYQRMRLGITSTLLHDSGYFGYNYVGASSVPVWFDEYAVNQDGRAERSLVAKHYLGQPLGNPREIPAANFNGLLEVDFENPGDLPDSLLLGPTFEITEDPAHVLGGARSAVFDFNPSEPASRLVFRIDNSLLPIQQGSLYQLMMRFKVLSRTNPEDYEGLLQIGFVDSGGSESEYLASATLWDADTGQSGELRTGLAVSWPGVEATGTLAAPARVVVDDLVMVQGSSVFRRDFENGVVLANPSPEAVELSQAQVAGPLQRTGIRRILGTQDPAWNDGSAVTEGISLPPADGIVLLADRRPAPPPTAPSEVFVVEGGASARLGWSAAGGTVAGHLVRYGMNGGDLTRFALAGQYPSASLEDLEPGTDYQARVGAFDFLGNLSPYSETVTFRTGGSGPARPVIEDLPWLVPGATAEIAGSGLADGLYAAEPLYPPVLAGTRVLVNGVPAPIVVTDTTRVLILAPWNLGGDEAVVRLEQDGVAGPARRTQVRPALPLLWTWEGDSGIAFRPDDLSPIVDGDPAVPGEAINLLASHLGVMEPLPDPGSLPAPEARPLVLPEVTIDGITANVTDARLFNDLLGFYTVTLEVPEGIGQGILEVAIASGGVAGNIVRIPFDNRAN